MKKLLIFNALITLILLLLFLFQTYLAMDKYLAFQTKMSTSNIDEGLILYPSITVCKNYLNGLSSDTVDNSSMTVKEKINILHQNYWSKEKLFYFFSHSKMFNITFPCNTLDTGAMEQGKPCSFPSYQAGIRVFRKDALQLAPEQLKSFK